MRQAYTWFRTMLMLYMYIALCCTGLD